VHLHFGDELCVRHLLGLAVVAGQVEELVQFVSGRGIQGMMVSMRCVVVVVAAAAAAAD
jgi:hypothetical protein